MERRWVVSPTYRSVIEAVKQARIDQGISQRELARRLKKPPSLPNKIELMERRLDILEFVAIAKALGLDVHDLLGRVMMVLPEDVEL